MSRKWWKSGTDIIRMRLPGGRPARRIAIAERRSESKDAGSVLGSSHRSLVPSSKVTYAVWPGESFLAAATTAVACRGASFIFLPEVAASTTPGSLPGPRTARRGSRRRRSSRCRSPTRTAGGRAGSRARRCRPGCTSRRWRRGAPGAAERVGAGVGVGRGRASAWASVSGAGVARGSGRARAR